MYLWLMEFSQYSWHSPAMFDHDSYSEKNPGYLYCSVQVSDNTYSECLDFKGAGGGVSFISSPVTSLDTDSHHFILSEDLDYLWSSIHSAPISLPDVQVP